MSRALPVHSEPRSDSELSGSKPATSADIQALSAARYAPATIGRLAGKLLPAWLHNYHPENLLSDLQAGIIVAIMLVPQAMAYALLAGLPPQVGLYASILPPLLYGFFGSSRTLAVGPVALVSLLVAAGLAPLAAAGSAEYWQLAIILALLVAIVQILMGAIRIGTLVNFISHPVLSGFTSAAAIMIGISQLNHLLGIRLPPQEAWYGMLFGLYQRLGEANPVTLWIGVSSLLVLIFFKTGLPRLLRYIHLPEAWILPVAKSGPLVVVLLSTLMVQVLRLDQNAGVAVVGSLPSGLPPITIPGLDLKQWQALLPTALAIGLVGFLESISVAKSLASKRREKVKPNQELLALGVANLGAAFTGGYPVTGGLSRSVVNFSVGARSGLASMITALLMLLTVVFMAPVFTFLPRAVLAAIILVAVGGLIDTRTVRFAWRYNKADAFSLLVAFSAVLALGVEKGIAAGVGLSLLLYLMRTSQPHIAVVGQVGESEHYRNVLRHEVTTHAHILSVRVDESLYFANAQYLETTILNMVADRPAIRHVLLICSAINFIDASALETLENRIREMSAAGIVFHLAEVKGPVMDRLERVGFTRIIGQEHIYLSTHQAIQALA